jgi:hypothetical protein
MAPLNEYRQLRSRWLRWLFRGLNKRYDFYDDPDLRKEYHNSLTDSDCIPADAHQANSTNAQNDACSPVLDEQAHTQYVSQNSPGSSVVATALDMHQVKVRYRAVDKVGLEG